MRERTAKRPTHRLHISDEIINSLSASMAAGNTRARVSLKDTSCPTCAKPSLCAAAVFRSTTVTGYVPHRVFDVVTHCKAEPCNFTGETSGRFTLTG